VTAQPGSLPAAVLAPRAAARRGATRRLRAVALNGAGLLVAVLTLAPIVWMISTAFKPQREIFSLTPHPLPAHPTLANFGTVFSGSAVGISFWRFLTNSMLVTVTAVLASSLIALLAAVAVARFRFRTSFLIMLPVVQMLPQQALVIALFIDFRALNLLDSLPGLILLYTAFALPISIWMLRNFVAAVPREMEAAAIDGAGPARIFWRILFPLVAPGLVATSVFSFIFAWNEYIFALTFLSPNYPAKFTLPIYVTYFMGQHSSDWGAIMAASTLYTIAPILFFLLVQRRMARGLAAGAVKG
jgi:N,N'-diacetylchitobiose transport system permease protein